MTTTLVLDVDKLHGIPALPTTWAMRQAVAFVADMAGDPAFAESGITPLLEEAKDARDWYVARRLVADEGSYSLRIFVWSPGSATKGHVHSSWGAFGAAAGTVFEERYERLDDGSTPDHARLKKVWELSWSLADRASTVSPGDGGIHRDGNRGSEVAVTAHLYGSRTGEADGWDYDPSRDHVCNRPEEGGDIAA
jgi:predicted metal-dependent enzyme (double-stranded beta helix superfamily)